MFKVILTIANVSVILEVYATLQNDGSLEIMSTRTVSLKVKQIYIYIYKFTLFLNTFIINQIKLS